ncbi:MAG: OprO/OprP family phosphate-selective porin [Bacteroidales bacterium]|nr:OprO/OprP family phosphate-selective porin [Bacteroidales bacterium]
MRRFLLLIALMVSVCYGSAEAQTINDLSAQVGKGIRFKTDDDLFYLKFTTRIQTRWDFIHTMSNSTADSEFENKAWVKRARLKFDGYFLNKHLVYKIEYDLAGGYVRDALFKYKKNNIELWFGQGKLPSNRERVVSSANMQLVDRSVFNKYYTLDRDAGIQLHHKFKIGNALVYDRWAVTSGSGIRDNNYSPGISFTGKLEVLPLGEFSKKGLYKSADLAREETPKIAFAAFSNYNVDAYKERGQLGGIINGEADLLSIGGDFLLKYRGYSLMIEAANRSVTDDNEFVYDQDGEIAEAYYTGYGANVQTGYLFKNNWELSGRYSFTKPDETQFHDEITDYTLGVSKYIIGHNFKFQGDVTFRDNVMGQDQIITRFQMEFQF